MARITGRRCSSKRKDGTACMGWALPGSDFCLAHDPSPERRDQWARGKAIHRARLAPAEAAARVAAGEINADLRPPRDRAELRELVATAVLQTMRGQLDPKCAAAVIQLAQRGMGLFPDPAQVDPHDAMDDLELRAELSKELRAVEARIARAARVDVDAPSGGNGGNGYGYGIDRTIDDSPPLAEMPQTPKGGYLAAAIETGRGLVIAEAETEIAESEHEAQRWPEVDP